MDMWMLVIGNALIFGAGVGVGILEAEKRIQKQTPTYTNYKPRQQKYKPVVLGNSLLPDIPEHAIDSAIRDN